MELIYKLDIIVIIIIFLLSVSITISILITVLLYSLFRERRSRLRNDHTKETCQKCFEECSDIYRSNILDLQLNQLHQSAHVGVKPKMFPKEIKIDAFKNEINEELKKCSVFTVEDDGDPVYKIISDIR